MIPAASASAITRGYYRISVSEVQGSGRFQGHKIVETACPPQSLISVCPIPELILPEKTWEGIKPVFFRIKVTTYISEFLNLAADITAQ